MVAIYARMGRSLRGDADLGPRVGDALGEFLHVARQAKDPMAVNAFEVRLHQRLRYVGSVLGSKPGVQQDGATQFLELIGTDHER